MTTEPKHLVRDGATPSVRVKHPRNPKSDLRMARLSDVAGLERVGVSLARVAPGKESFVPHAHLGHEEWVYVLSGRGRALIGDETYDVGPGDFLGFPVDGTVHHLSNPGPDELVYLQGGERQGFDAARFPTLGQVGMPGVVDGHMSFAGEAEMTSLPFTAWLADDGDDG